jgi:hypothetical protein
MGLARLALLVVAKSRLCSPAGQTHLPPESLRLHLPRKYILIQAKVLEIKLCLMTKI